MKCQNCGMNEANVSYTEIINGKKMHVVLCDKCANEMNIGMNMNFDFNFNDVLGAFFNEPSLVKTLTQAEPIACDKCGTTYDEFANTGMFGCDNCYNVFSDRIDNVLPRLQGANRHVGRRLNNINKPANVVNSKSKKEKTELEKLQDELKACIEKEEYEKAAVIRDKIKKIESKSKGIERGE